MRLLRSFVLACITLAAVPSFAADPAPAPVKIVDPTNGKSAAVDASGNLKVTGSVSATNPSVSTDDAAAPGSSTKVGFKDGLGNLKAVSATDPLPITGSISATNPSIGTNAAAAPTSSTQIGVKDGSGNLQPASSSNPVPVSAAALPLPAGASQDRTTAAAPNACRLSDGAAFYKGTTPSDTQPVSIAATVTTTDTHTTAAAPLSCRLTDGSAFYVGPTGAQLPTALDGSGFLKTHEQGTATVTGTVTATQATGSNLHVQVDSAPTTTITGTVTANIGTSGNLALDATLTGGSQRTKITDGTSNVQLATGAPGLSDFGLITRSVLYGVNSASSNQALVTDGAGSLGVASLGEVFAYQTNASISTNTTVSTGHSFTNRGAATLTAYVQIFGVAPGGSPTLQYTFTEQTNEGTALQSVSTKSFTGIGSDIVELPLTGAGTVQISYTSAGISSGSFSQVYVTLILRPQGEALYPDGIAYSATNAKIRGPTLMGVDGSNVRALRATNTTPGGTEYALVTRNIPSGTQAVSGTVTANAGTGTFTTSDTHTGSSGPLATELSDGASFYTAAKTGQLPAALDGSGFLKTHEQGTAAVSGTVTANLGTLNGAALDATLTGGTQKAIVRGAAKGSTAAADATTTAIDANHQALDVSVNGTATVSGSVSVSNFPATQPVSGTVTANAGTGTMATSNASSDPAFIAPAATSAPTKAAVVMGKSADGTPVYNPIPLAAGSGSVVVSGTVTSNVGTTNGLALDATLTGGTQKTKITGTGGDVTVTAANALKVDGSAVTQPVSGTVTANAGTGTFTNQQSNNTADYDTGAATQTMTMFGLALPASGGAVAGGTSTNPLRTDPTGTTTQPVSGTITANIGTAGTLALDATLTGGTARTKVTDGTNNAAVKAASTAAATTDPSLVVALSPNSPLYGGVKGVTPAQVISSTAIDADHTGLDVAVRNTPFVAQSGTWTVQPGNTANTTPWLVKPHDGTNAITIKAASTASVAGDTSEVVAISPNSNTVQNIVQSSTAVSYASSSATVGTPTATGTNGSITYLWHPSTSAKRVEIDHIGVVCSAGAATTAGYLLFSLVRITAENGTPGGVTATTANPKMDNADANSTITLRWGASGAPTRATNAAVNQLAPNNAWNGNEIVMWDTAKTGKPLVARASVSEGWEVYVSTSTTMSAAATCEANFYWTEI